MRRIVSAAAVVVMLAALGAVATASEQSTVTVKGEIVDLACYLGHGARGEGHRMCAETCLKNGEPMGLLTADGAVYLLLAPHDNATAFEQAKSYAADQVSVTGPLAEKAGIKAISVMTVTKL